MSQNIWLTSDLHLCHTKDFLWSPRGFSSSEEHDEAIIDNINEVVKPDDILYILGDLMLENSEQGTGLLRQLRCKNVNIILGNHDTEVRQRIYQYTLGYHILGWAAPAKFNNKSFFLSHYPTATTNLDDDKRPWTRVYNLCGHSHTTDKWDARTDSIHVELDAWNNYPVNLEEIYTLIRQHFGIQ